MVWVAAGLGIFGLANFVFLALAGRELGPAGSAPVAVAWTVLNAVGIGLFQPLEQETGRTLSAMRSRGGHGSNLHRMVRYTIRCTILIAAIGAIGLPWIGNHVFSGAKELVVVVVLGLIGQALAYFARGVLAGSNRFARYGDQLGLDGSLRLAAAGVLFTTGSGSRLAYGMILVLAPVIATLTTVSLSALTRVWRSREDAVSSMPMTSLVANSTASQLLANFGPIAMALLATVAQQGLSGRFVAAVTVARIPLFLFAAIQAVFLPTLAALVANDSVVQFVRTLRRALFVTVALGVAGVGGIALLGHWVMWLIYGDEFTIGTRVLVLIAISGALFMLAQVFAQALLAHHGDRASAIAWTCGLVASAITLAVPVELSARVALALCTGAGVALLVLVSALARRMNAWRRSVSPTSSEVPE
ncbi:MAG: lipopolysaccharide biosynthesis protein [Cellulomonadaceae bacterium]